MRLWSFGVLALLSVVACNKPAEGEGSASSTGSSKAPVVASSAPAAASEAPKTADAPKKMKHRMRGNGPSAMLFRGVHKLKLDDAQKTKLDELHKGMAEANGPAEEMKTLNADLAAGIKAGKLDDAKLKADQEAVEKVMKARLEKEADALNSLHALLKPEQRKDLVANVRDQMKKRADKMKEWKDKAPDGKGPDGKGPEGKGPDGKGKGPHGPGKLGGGPGMGFGFMLKGLDLDDAQQKKVDALAPKKPDPKMAEHLEEMQKSMDALLDAFEKDGFDAKKLAPFDGKMAMPDHGKMDTKFLADLLPILKPEQREKLADRMTKHGGGKGHGGPKMAPPAPSAKPDGDDKDDDDDDDDDKK